MMLRNTDKGLHLLEEVIDEFEQCLKAKLPAKLAELESQYPDHLVLPVPYDDAYHTPTNLRTATIGYYYPAISIMGARVGNDMGAEGMQGEGWGGDMELMYQMAVFVLCKGEDEDQLSKYLYRYSLAVAEVLVQNDALEIGSCFLDLIDYENPQISTDDDFIRDVPIQFVVVTTESY